MTTKTKPYDVVDYLHSEQDIQAYLDAVMESGASAKAVKKAFMDAERARAKIAGQEPSYQMLDMVLGALSRTSYNPLFSVSA